ncbi:MAG: SAM-dependent methyltransferase [Bacteroidia bacterium]|nr:SAM-dependent methyltransferase [Bacteroidia bacterium]
MQHINEILAQMGMVEKESGFTLCSASDISIPERIAIETAKIYHHPYAIHFRRFTNGQVVPQAYIYDRDFTEEELKELHKKIWSSQVVSLYYIITDKNIKVINARKPIKITKDKTKGELPFLTKLDDLTKVVQWLENNKVSAKYLDSGLFLDIYKNEFSYNGTPYKQLLDYLIEVKDILIKHELLKKNEFIVNKLLIMCILVKYMEEKKDNHDTKLFEINRDFYKDFHSLSEVIENGNVIELFDKLASHFRGSVFSWGKEEKETLSKILAEYKQLIAHYFNATINPRTKQLFAWNQYSFNHLPVELISGIYEAFLPNQAGVVYTPPYLVNLLIDDCMPLDKSECFENQPFKVLDPACGSGIFLVAAYKRLVDWEIINHFKKTGEWKTPSTDRLKAILEENIFGVEIKKEAIKIAVFSFCIALCERLSPMQILEELRFDKLNGDNFYGEDYFEVHTTLADKQFQLIIGNPPFGELNKDKYETYISALAEKGVENIPHIPKHELSFLFLSVAIKNLHISGQLCLILPSKFLYNSTAFAYKKQVLKTYQVEKIIDFTHLSNVIFANKKAAKSNNTDVAICALFVKNMLTVELPETLELIVPKRLFISEQKIAFEMDSYDYHTVKYEMAMNDPHIWKANLLGGGGLHRIIRYFRTMPTLGNFLKEKEEEGWKYCSGYETGQERDNKTEEDMIKKGYKPAKHLTGFKVVDTENFTLEGILTTRIEDKKLFASTREEDKEIFLAPHLLIREVIDLPVLYLDKDLLFRKGIIGVHSKDKNALIRIENTFNQNRKLYQFYISATSSRAGITRSFSTIKKEDIDNLPFPEDPEELALTPLETIIQDDVLEYLIKLGTSTDTSGLYKSLGKDDEKILSDFGDTYCETLNVMYEKNGICFYKKSAFIEDDFIIYSFAYSSQKQENFELLSKLDEEQQEKLNHIKAMITKNLGSVYMHRLVRYYDHENGEDLVYMVKPAKLYYWLKSIAIRDADDTFSDFVKAGY